MPLSWNEIRDRATSFQKRWKNAEKENAESQSFWTEFLHIIDIDRKRVALFEKQVEMKRVGKKVKNGRIDLFWPGALLVEMKSAGQDLDRAFSQAADYFEALPARDLPRYILVSDFQRFRLFDLQEGVDHAEFTIDKLRDRIKLFGFIAGYTVQAIKPQDPVNIKAAERMGALHDALKASGYTGHDLEMLLVRLLFCLFADDTGIFTPAQSFREWIENGTKPDGSDLGRALAEFFDVLNTEEAKRQTSQLEDFKSFPYINGKLFEKTLRPPAFNAKMRELLLEACALDWSAISPAIFGALFQSIMDDKARRNLGAHYTSEENILKLIKALFLDALWSEFEKVRNNAARLKQFHEKLRTLTFLDPACGCGNFLVITYRELRNLELEIMRSAASGGPKLMQALSFLSVDVDQFYGIEIEEFPAQIAQVAMWLVDHQMNVRVSDEFGMYFARIPLKSSATIINGNALRINWNDVLSADRCSYVLGNPPFVGSKFLSDSQRDDARTVFGDVENEGLLDYVGAWYVKSTRFIKLNPQVRCAFVSTNSITQGEQVGALWGWVLSQGIYIHFAHRTFRWSNEASGKAAVHCVIIGFGLGELPQKTIYEYDDIQGEPHAVPAVNINPYLIDGPNIIAAARMAPIGNIQLIANGSIPADGGNLILSPDERDALVATESRAKRWIRPYLGAEGFIRNEYRYCLWLVDCPPSELRLMPRVLERVARVKAMREDSKKVATQAKAATPTLFTENRQPKKGRYLAIPRTSSENRRYLPIGYLDCHVIAANDLQIVPDATLFSFGVLASCMHRAWTDVTSGRLKSDIRYSVKITYNAFPWPDSLTNKQREVIEAAAQGVLDARAAHPESSLADLYDPLTMPPDLVKAHQMLDAAVDAVYANSAGKKTFKNDAQRVAFLFELYQKYNSLLPIETNKPKRTRKSKPNF
jgi:hypothetical protein